MGLVTALVLGLSLGIGIPPSTQADSDPTQAKAMVILQSLREVPALSEPHKLIDAWLDSLRRELNPEDSVLGAILLTTGVTLAEEGDSQLAALCFEHLVELSTKISGRQNLETLSFLSWLARAQEQLGDYASAKPLHEEILAEQVASLGVDHLDTLTTKANLANNLRGLGEFEKARELLEEVLSARSRALGAAHPDTLTAEANLAGILRALGKLQEARQRYEKVLTVLSRVLGEEHQSTLTVKASLAGVLRALGDLAGARQQQEEVLATSIRILGLQHLDTLFAQSNLAGTLQALGDFSGAQRLQEGVLTAMRRVLGDEHPNTLTAEANLANTLRALGDLSGARRLQEEVLAALSRRVGEEHPATLMAKANLAMTLQALDDLAEARRLQKEVLFGSRRVLGIQHPTTLTAMLNLAITLRRADDLESARRFLEVRVKIREKALGPQFPLNTEEDATTFFYLGVIQSDLGLLEAAAASLGRSLAALEAQTTQTDVSEDIKANFKARYEDYYHFAVDIELRRRDLPNALFLLERYRTLSLPELLRRHRFDGADRISTEARKELEGIALRYDQLTRQRDDLQPESDRTLLEEQAQLRRRRELIQGRIIESRRAAEGRVQPLRLEEIRPLLDRGTLMLAYSIGNLESHVFALTSDGALEVFPVDARAPELWSQVSRLRSMDLRTEEASEEARGNLSQWLYDKLLQPVAARIVQAERLLILPDGPLNYLSFATVRIPPTDGSPKSHYLVEQKPIHVAQSATTYAEVQNRRARDEGVLTESRWRWVGFGAPEYAVTLQDGRRIHGEIGTVRCPIGRRIWGGFPELPFTSSEIREIAARFPIGETKMFLGNDATEDHAREILGQARIVHFATHGLADPEYPMDSFLALSLQNLPEGSKHNGLLQAWEIVDDLKLDADLVVLSACQTGFGPNRGGEGLLSLSRAFQIAGARSVLASLWSVNDASTSELMIRFYKHLLAGELKDRALQLAQIELIRGPVMVENEKGEKEERDFSKPYYWGAFQLIGDWQ